MKGRKSDEVDFFFWRSVPSVADDLFFYYAVPIAFDGYKHIHKQSLHSFQSCSFFLSIPLLSLLSDQLFIIHIPYRDSNLSILTCFFSFFSLLSARPFYIYPSAREHDYIVVHHPFFCRRHFTFTYA
jgi:hypothetical protein